MPGQKACHHLRSNSLPQAPLWPLLPCLEPAPMHSSGFHPTLHRSYSPCHPFWTRHLQASSRNARIQFQNRKANDRATWCSHPQHNSWSSSKAPPCRINSSKMIQRHPRTTTPQCRFLQTLILILLVYKHYIHGTLSQWISLHIPTYPCRIPTHTPPVCQNGKSHKNNYIVNGDPPKVCGPAVHTLVLPMWASNLTKVVANSGNFYIANLMGFRLALPLVPLPCNSCNFFILHLQRQQTQTLQKYIWKKLACGVHVRVAYGCTINGHRVQSL